MDTNKQVKKVKQIKHSSEELILGAQDEEVEVSVIDYLSKDMKYNVSILENGRTIEVNGREIGTFLGQNLKARNELAEGKKNVSVINSKGKTLYNIEVID